MSTDLQSLELLISNDYASLVIVTCVVYDYILTFPREVQYIWRQSWTRVSTMFFLVRYVGLCWIMASAFICSSFIPGPLEVAVFLLSFWAFAVFLSAADLVMIFRVHAMWHRSRTIIFILSFMYMLQIIATLTTIGTYNNPAVYFSVSTIQVLDFTFCDSSYVHAPPMLNVYLAIPRFVLGATQLVLAVLQTVRHSFQMYRVTRKWGPNCYMRLLARDGIIYFFVNMLYQVGCMLNQGGTPPNDTWTIIFNTLIYISFYPLAPRLIISVRELYARDVRGCSEGIDTGFGLSSQSNASPDTAVSAIVFMDADPVWQDPPKENDVDELDGISIEMVKEGMVWQV